MIALLTTSCNKTEYTKLSTLHNLDLLKQSTQESIIPIIVDNTNENFSWEEAHKLEGTGGLNGRIHPKYFNSDLSHLYEIRKQYNNTIITRQPWRHKHEGDGYLTQEGINIAINQGCHKIIKISGGHKMNKSPIDKFDILKQRAEIMATVDQHEGWIPLVSTSFFLAITYKRDIRPIFSDELFLKFDGGYLEFRFFMSIFKNKLGFVRWDKEDFNQYYGSYYEKPITN